MPHIVLGPGIDYVLWWLLAIALLIVSRTLLTEPAPPPAAAAPARHWRKLVFYLCFAAVLGASAWVRLHMPNPNNYCFGDDEAWNCQYSYDLAHWRRFIEFFTYEEHSKELLFHIVMAPFFYFVGNTYRTAVTFLAIIGIATVLAAYNFGKHVFANPWYGIFAMAIIGAAPGFMLEGRIPLRRLMCPLAFLLVLVCIHKVFERSWTRDFISLGMALGFGMLIYHSFRLIPTAAVLTLLALILADRRFVARNAGKMVLCLLAASVVFTPIFLTLQTQWGAYNGRAVGEWHNFLEQGDLSKTIPALFQHFTPLFFDLPFSYYPPVSFPLFFGGLAIALFRLRNKMNLFAVISFVLCSIPYVCSTDNFPPVPIRSTLLLPLFAYFALLWINSIARPVPRLFPLLTAFMLLLSAGDLAVGSRIFLEWRSECLEDEREASEFAVNLYREEGGYVHIVNRRWSPLIKFLAYDVPGYYDLQGPEFYRVGLTYVYPL